MNYAGFWKRLFATIIDAIIITLAITIISIITVLIIYGILHLIEANPGTRIKVWVIAGSIGLMIEFWGIWIYHALMESSTSQGTLGKMALGIKVMDNNGNPISFERATARYFSKYISSMTLLVGYLMTAFSSRKRALHDIISGCLVGDKYYS